MSLAVPFIRFPNGHQQPIIGFGTWAGRKNATEVGQAVRSALKCGYRHFDCAALYDNQREIGQALQQALRSGQVKRAELFVTSKLWNTEMEPSAVEGACRKTLSDLQLDYLDLYLVHWPFAAPSHAREPYTPEQYLATWRAMEHLVDIGLVRSIGVSNMTISKLTPLLRDCRIKPATNQVERHPYLAQKELVAFCQAHGVGITAYSPLGVPFCAPDPDPSAPSLLLDPVVVKIAEEVGATPAQVALAWNIHHKIAVIPKSVSEARLKENLAAVHVKLSESQMKQLDALDRNYRYYTLKVMTWKPNQSWEELWQ